MNRRVNVEPSVGIEPSRRDPYLLEPTSAGNRWVTHRVQKRLKSRSRVSGHWRRAPSGSVRTNHDELIGRALYLVSPKDEVL